MGRAASDGIGFLPIYLGPTLMIALWWLVMRKIIRISKASRITSLADFIASRYGKSALLGGLVTVIAVIGILPYISLQLKAISTSYAILLQYPEISMPASAAAGSHALAADTAFWVALILAAFTILFGTRHLDAAEHHEGMVAAIAFESLVKLLAFLAVGLFVTYGMFDGVGDIFARARAEPRLSPMLAPLEGVAGGYASWVWLTILSMLAIMFLPRQFQVAVIENKNEQHLNKAIWLFPLYMLAINLFVLPIAFGGNLHFAHGTVDADTFVLTLPMAAKQEGLALLVFIGGLSAATGMVIVETIALSTMVCNDLVMPVLLRLQGAAPGRAARPDRAAASASGAARSCSSCCSATCISASPARPTRWCRSAWCPSPRWRSSRRCCWAASSGRAARAAARWRACSPGFAVWFYTLLLPALARSGWLPLGLLEQGPFGIALLKPLELFGLAGLDQITHAMIWSMIANIGAYVAVSLLGHAERGRDAPGEPVRRRVPPERRGGRRALLARHGLGAGPLRPAGALPGRRRGRRRVRANTRARGDCAGRTRRSSPTPSSCTSSRCSWRARSAPPRRASWSARW